MGKIGTGKSVLGANIDAMVYEYIKARAARLDLTASWAGGRIVQYWMDHGAPPLSEADKKMPVLTYSAFTHAAPLEKSLSNLKPARR